MRISILFLIFSLNGCITSKQTVLNQTLAFTSFLGSFAIDTPNGWTKVAVQGVDSYVGRIAIDTKDTIEFDLGYYSNDLTEKEPEDFEGDDYSKYAKTKILYETIDGYQAKIVVPKRYRIGMSGVYIDSLWKDREDKVKFNFYGNNLRKTNQKIFFQATKTLRFTKPK